MNFSDSLKDKLNKSVGVGKDPVEKRQEEFEQDRVDLLTCLEQLETNFDCQKAIDKCHQLLRCSSANDYLYFKGNSLPGDLFVRFCSCLKKYSIHSQQLELIYGTVLLESNSVKKIKDGALIIIQLSEKNYPVPHLLLQKAKYFLGSIHLDEKQPRDVRCEAAKLIIEAADSGYSRAFYKAGQIFKDGNLNFSGPRKTMIYFILARRHTLDVTRLSDIESEIANLKKNNSNSLEEECSERADYLEGQWKTKYTVLPP